MEEIALRGDYIKLEQALKLMDGVSGGEAKMIIADGEVTVNGEVELRRGKKLHKGDRVVYGDMEIVVV